MVKTEYDDSEVRINFHHVHPGLHQVSRTIKEADGSTRARTEDELEIAKAEAIIATKTMYMRVAEQATAMYMEAMYETKQSNPELWREVYNGYLHDFRTSNGITFCFIYVAGRLVDWSVCFCSRKDSFNRRIGRLVSFGLLVKHSDKFTYGLREFLNTIKVG